MKNSCLLASISLLIISSSLPAQKLKKADRVILTNLKEHIVYLSDDRLEGRRAGTQGEKLASEYISAQFQKIGLQPKGENNSWLQPFEIYDGRKVSSSSYLIINGHDLKVNEEYFPFPFSANKSAEAAVAMALAEKGVPWFIDLKDIVNENKDNPHFDLEETLRTRINQAYSKGATALIFYNSSEKEEDLKFNSKDRAESAKIPVLYITKEARKKYLNDESANLDIKLKIILEDKKRTGNNVVAFLDNGAASTVILGAHYDHLGYGEDGTSMSRNNENEKMIHNGADDNASGTAALIELARLLKQLKKKNNNYLFIAFSAEELGLNGSKYFTDHPAVDLKQVDYMINMDMVGRLNDSSRALTVGGFGTSPSWSPLFASLSDTKYFSIKFDSSGTGPSDHTSFYRKEIPVLFFFTGLHPDYHKPTDDYNKINYPGEVHIVKFILDIINKTNNMDKLAFSKTREMQTISARFTVTLGIMPDYSFNGSGVRVDGVSDGKAAQKAGIKTGDIIVQLAEHPTFSLESYMEALSKFKKGDKTTVRYKRGNEVEEAEVQF